MKRHVEIEIGAGAILLLALLCFIDQTVAAGAVAAAAFAHELGHVLALSAFGRRITRVRVGAFGLELDYAPRLDGAPALLCFAAGPVAGLIYALTAGIPEGDFWRVSAGAGILLTAFNLLPICPLDGGRMARAILKDRRAERLSLCCALILAAGGGWLLLKGYSPMPLFVSLWLLKQNVPDSDLKTRMR